MQRLCTLLYTVMCYAKNLSKIPNTKINRTVAGSIYVRYGFIQSCILSPLPVFASVLKLLQPQPYLVTQKSRYTSEPRGRNILLTRKSSTSRTAPPKISKPLQLQILYPSTQGSESAVMSTRFTSPVFFLLHPVSSILQHMMFSKTARTVESAANDINMKKRLPHNLPRCIFANMLGRVMNIRLGPDVCSVLHNTLLEFFCAYSIDFFHIIYFQQLIFGCRNCKAVDF